MLKQRLGCGNIRYDRRLNIYTYKIDRFDDIQTRLIPFIVQYYQYFNIQRRKFAVFYSASEVIDAGGHLTSKGLFCMMALK